MRTLRSLHCNSHQSPQPVRDIGCGTRCLLLPNYMTILTTPYIRVDCVFITSLNSAVFRATGTGGKPRSTSGVQRSCEVMPDLPASGPAASGRKLVKQSSRDSNDGSVSSEGSKWVANKHKWMDLLSQNYCIKYNHFCSNQTVFDTLLSYLFAWVFFGLSKLTSPTYSNYPYYYRLKMSKYFSSTSILSLKLNDYAMYRPWEYIVCKFNLT